MSPPQTYSASYRLVFQEGGSQKFWNIDLDGAAYVVWFGRIGTNGQRQSKEFGAPSEAKAAYEKLVAEKLKKGYVHADGAPGPSSHAAPPPVKAKTKSDADPSAEPAAAPKKKNAKAKAAEAEEARGAEPAAEDAPAPAAVVPAPPPAPPAAIDLDLPRRIDLAPEDWRRAAFRRLPDLPRDAVAPFDRDACLARLAKLRTEDYGWNIRWGGLGLTPRMSAEEARFWLQAMLQPRDAKADPKALAAKLAKMKTDGPSTADEIKKLLAKSSHRTPSQVASPLAALLRGDEIVQIVLGLDGPDGMAGAYLVAAVCRYAVPWFSAAEAEAARKLVRAAWNPSSWPASPDEFLPTSCHLAAALGMHDEVLAVVAGWADDRFRRTSYDWMHQRPQDLLCGLGSSELFLRHWRRLKLQTCEPEQIRTFLACSEYAALDVVKDSILAETNKEKCEELLRTFALVHAPEAAEPMLECLLSAKAPGAARAWLETNTAFALPGLIRVAGGKGKLAEAALDRLRDEKRLGRAEAIAAAVARETDAAAAEKVRKGVLDHEEKVYTPFDAASTPAWLKEVLAAAASGKAKPAKLPGWASASLLPPLSVGDRKLSDDQAAAVLAQLAATPLGTPNPLLAAVKEHVDRHARDAFVWKLFQAWLIDGAPNKEKWAFGAIGHVGGDGAAMKLTPLVRVWPGESQHARAVFGLECLRAIGSDVALMQLSGIAQKLKFKGLKTKAEQFVDEIAKERGMSRAELEDRVVPDCGLDEHGRRTFSFGPRGFSFVLGAGLKAMVRDGEGKIRDDLPKPAAKDDAAAAEESVAEWKLMKNQIKEVAAIQAGRLEQAMTTGRRWKVDEFETLLVRHPLMTHLTRSLLWEAFDAKGNRQSVFRVADERDYADADDAPVSLASAAAVGVAHPLALSEEERAAWGQVFGDYEIVSPFPQLGRAVYALEAGEAAQTELTRFKGLKLPAPTLVFTLEKLGWIRGAAMDGGCFDEHSKQFPSAGVTAVVGYDGVAAMGYLSPDENLAVQHCVFVVGMRAPSGYGWKQEKLKKLGDVPPVAMSEVLADLHVLKSKAK